MSTESNSTRYSDEELRKHEHLMKRIKGRRRNIQSFVSNLEPKGVLLTNVNIICSAIATFLTAAPAVGGKSLMDAFGAGPDTIGWRVLLALAALLSLVSVIVANLYKSQDIATHLSKARACDAKLDGLEMLLELKRIALDDAATKYTQILPEIDFIPDQSALAWVNGEIKEPQSSQAVTNKVSCSGWTEGVGLNLHLWLVVEVEGIKGIWPKEGEILAGTDGFWHKVVWEDGTRDHFSLSLFVANQKANRRIRAWLDKCDHTGSYPELRRPPGMRRIDRVDGLRRQAASQK